MYKATMEAIQRYAKSLSPKLKELNTVDSLLNRRVREIANSAASGDIVSINQMALVLLDTQAMRFDYETIYTLVHHGFIILSPTIETPYNHKIKQFRESLLLSRYKAITQKGGDMPINKVWIRETVEYGKNLINIIYPADYMIEIDGKNYYVNFPKKRFDLSYLLYGHFHTHVQDIFQAEELHKWVTHRTNLTFKIHKDRPPLFEILAVDYLKLPTLMKHFFIMAEHYAANYNILKDEFTQALYKRIREHI